MGKQFVIQTDHQALQWLDKFKKKNSRLTRWSLELQPYQFKVENRKRPNTDGLSRLPSRFAFKKEGGNVTVRYDNPENDDSANIELADQTEDVII